MKRIAFVLLVLTACGKGKISEEFLLQPKAFQQKLISTPGATLLDVRTRDEVQKGYIKGAMNFDFNTPEFQVLIAGMDKAKPYFIYCASGVRSAKAAGKMKSMDFQNVYLLDGGMKAWVADSLPVVVPKFPR